ncbi:hypothetical protein BcepSauron_063 [Burkholderia phage BcepSauron]|uniref:Uncharacterized protein n=1 Tax=Burkholderia phage BcepSauron TaxID=2530033 RepID=A0A482MMR1_9CAUD|nr:hypothetical protein H1O17_gp063 [Burkholderia phage BcepSauron]QBQ74443.1 hypothetical protein BcepSauron_063 [Burkholderia phage BcepSauron]
MQVTFKGEQDNAQQHDGTKERIRTVSLVALNPVTGKLEHVCELRYWASRSTSATNLYASLWVRCGAATTSGYGVAKTSAGRESFGLAFDRALVSAGIDIRDDAGAPIAFESCEQGAGNDALLAIARTLGYTEMILI